MEGKTVFENEYLRILSYPDGIYVETFKKGFSMEGFSNVLALHPNIEITSFSTLKKAIDHAPAPPQRIGRLKERIVIEIIEHGLKATVVFNLTKEELSPASRESLVKETALKLKEKGIVFGIKKELLSSELISGRPYVIAEGIPAIPGRDAVITMYKLGEVKPLIHEDGKANFYELTLINRVKAGDWLGERIEATEGVPGRSVTGDTIKPEKGKTFPLSYDRNSVMEVSTNGKTTLYSKVDGGVSYIDDKITVSNHLEIDGDVGFRTGNIRFDGYLTIKGTVLDGFSVVASRDIEIKSDLGVGNVKEITSTGGSIYIKGGIAAKGQAVIKAANDIFTKFVDNATLISGRNAHIGFYCINSNVKAREVTVESIKGQIIGGTIQAEVRVAAPIIGSEIEKRTVVEVTGFNRRQLAEELGNVISTIAEFKDEQAKIKVLLSRLSESKNLNPFQRREYNDHIDRLLQIKEKLKELEDKKKTISSYLKIHGEGEIVISKKVYPNSYLTIKNNTIDINSATLSVAYFVQDGLLKQIN
ncbi:MAG: FapA family protein [Clostridiales bacterium]|nr:FapA family protein [Eubacteriales bacterium]MDH7565818.1 FapA family protein [Clostridiales bacterium]